MESFYETKACWGFGQDIRMGISRPVMGMTLLNPMTGQRFPAEGEVEVEVDTGYDGSVLVPWRVYHDYRFYLLERPMEEWSVGETITGEEVTIIAAASVLRMPQIGLEADIELETFAGNDEFLLGLGFLRLLCSVVDGPSEKTCVAERASRLRSKP